MSAVFPKAVLGSSPSSVRRPQVACSISSFMQQVFQRLLMGQRSSGPLTAIVLAFPSSQGQDTRLDPHPATWDLQSHSGGPSLSALPYWSALATHSTSSAKHTSLTLEVHVWEKGPFLLLGWPLTPLHTACSNLPKAPWSPAGLSDPAWPYPISPQVP